MICASIKAETTPQALEKLHVAKQKGAELAEIRLDYLRELNLETLIAQRPLPLIATCRPKWEGGAYTGDESTRIMLLEEAGRLGAEYVDLEFKAYKDLPRCPAKKIVSFHDFDRTSPDLPRIVRKLNALQPDISKIACRANSTADLLALVEAGRLLQGAKTVLAMGDHAEPLRVLHGRLGYALTYAALDEPTAPGQPTLDELRGLYRAHEIDVTWDAYAVLGNPVAHSRGPQLWNAVLPPKRAVYLRILLDDVRLTRAVFEALNLQGASVTVPHKERVVPLLDEAERDIGAVNTIVRRDGRLSGYNTDWKGIVAALGPIPQGAKCLVFGAGGTARAAVDAIRRLGGEVFIVNRTFERALALGRAVREPIRDADVIINATRVGMNSDESVVPVDCLRPGAICFDAVYTPRMTRFLRDAQSRGCRVVTGDRMFLEQAMEQWRLFFGEEPPLEAFEAAYS